MESKKSYFNKTVFMKDITRFWAIWALEIVGFIVAGILPIYTSCNSIRFNEGIQTVEKIENMRDVFTSDIIMTSNPIVMALIAMFVAGLVFLYINNARDSYMIHSLPLKKETLFVSHYLAGAAIVVVPYVIFYAVITIMAGGFGVGISHSLIACMFETVIAYIFFYSLMCAVMMVSGNSFMAFIIYGVLNFLVVGITALWGLFSTILVYGLSDFDFFTVKGEIFSPMIYMIRKFGLMYDEKPYTLWGSFAIYIIPAVIFAVLALVLYKKRASETVGDTLSFKWCRPVFRTVFTLTGASAATLFLMFIMAMNNSYLSNETNNYPTVIILIIICGAACYFISDMILNKTFFIWKKTSYMSMGVLVAVLAGLVSLIHFGVSQMVIPKAENVQYVKIDNNAGTEYTYDNKAVIQDIVNTQKNIEIKYEDAVTYYDDEDSQYISIRYYLKGSHERRGFYYRWTEKNNKKNIESFRSLLKDNKRQVEGMFSSEYDNIVVDSTDIYVTEDKQISLSSGKNAAEQQLLYNALIKDMLTVDRSSYGKTVVNISLFINFDSAAGKEIRSKHSAGYIDAFDGNSVSISVYEGYTNTIEVLKKIGALKQ